MRYRPFKTGLTVCERSFGDSTRQRFAPPALYCTALPRIDYPSAIAQHWIHHRVLSKQPIGLQEHRRSIAIPSMIPK